MPVYASSHIQVYPFQIAAAMLSPEFRELWSRIKQKTTYRVQIDTEKLAPIPELTDRKKQQ